MTDDNEIWHVLDSRSFGGIESHVYHLSTAFAKEGQPIRVVFLQDYGDHPLEPMLAEADIAVMKLHGFLSLARALVKHSPLAIHTHGYKAGIWGRLLALLHPFPCISTFHNADANSWKMEIYRWLDEETARFADQAIAVSAPIAKRLPCNSAVVKNFVPVPKTPLSEGKEIAFVGRLSHEKAPDRFVELATQHPDLSFAVYGDGDMSEALAKPDNVTWHGQVTSMEEHWQNIGLLVIPSRCEGLPMAALEAMAHGVPVAAFALGALPQLLKTNENGFIAAADDMDELTGCIKRWSEMPETDKHEMRCTARHTIEDYYSPEAVLPRIIALYENVL